MAATLAAAALAARTAQAAPSAGQAAYDAAQTAFDHGDWAAAAAGFTSLVPASAAVPLSRSQAVIASRLAFTLLKLNRIAEAHAYALRAVAALPPADKAELAEAWETVGDSARFAFDYAEAADAYGRALTAATAAADKDVVLGARIGLAQARMTTDPAAAGADMEALLQDKALVGALSKPELAQIVDLRARAALNAGDLDTAAKAADRAVGLSGGLTTNDVTGSQVAIRNDAALVYGLRHQDDRTREYLTYTGAGHLKNMGWIGDFEGDLPVCGEDGDFGPQDVAAVQFAIDADGQVQGAAPIYVSRTGNMGAAFGRAVSSWRWNPDQLKGVQPFWRQTLVLQLRCQTRPTPESLGKPVFEQFSAWLGAQGAPITAAALRQPVAADDARLRETGPAALPAMLGRYGRGRDPTLEARLTAALSAQRAPASAWALFYLEGADRAARRAEGWRGRVRARLDALSAAVPLMRARFPDALATAWLQLQLALDLETAGDFPRAAPLLDAVLATPESVLPAGSPIRRVALLHAGMVARRLGRPADAADAQIAASGLDAEQCSMFDTHPIMTGNSVNGAYFPQEAMRWGFEGFAKEGFDIGDDGRVANVRTLVAYPPFVFDRSAEQAAKTFRYLPPKIGSQSVGCTGQTGKIAFRIGQ